ncbi:hypothetical protein RF20_09960 [Salmonella enterica]|nr:hypothetical protein [Salmonella enterica]ECH8206063.1 hypothetical protein [Salmonella enterica subsp. enterica]
MLRTFRRFASFLQFFAILQIFAVLPGKCFSHPMFSYEKLLSVLVAGSVCHQPSVADTTPGNWRNADLRYEKNQPVTTKM